MSTSPGTLREAAGRARRHIGVALTTLHFGDPEYTRIAAEQFDSLTPENHMKWLHVQPEPGRFEFGAGDALVAFARTHDMRVRGHTLVWHNQLAPWVASLPNQELRAAMLTHIDTTVRHWKGQIAQWDVVNEAVGSEGEPRENSPFTALGMFEYIAEAFHAAHEADPDAQLLYNDYEVEDENTPKSRACFELVERLKARGVPIHGMGFQMHVEPRDWPSPERIQRTLQRYADLGLTVEVTEMDVPVGQLPGTPEQKLAEQARLTGEIVAACLAVPACTGITFWGLADPHSWLRVPKFAALRGDGPHHPLLFDSEYHAKPVFHRTLEAFEQVQGR